MYYIKGISKSGKSGQVVELSTLDNLKQQIHDLYKEILTNNDLDNIVQKLLLESIEENKYYMLTYDINKLEFEWKELEPSIYDVNYAELQINYGRNIS